MHVPVCSIEYGEMFGFGFTIRRRRRNNTVTILQTEFSNASHWCKIVDYVKVLPKHIPKSPTVQSLLAYSKQQQAITWTNKYLPRSLAHLCFTSLQCFHCQKWWRRINEWMHELINGLTNEWIRDGSAGRTKSSAICGEKRPALLYKIFSKQGKRMPGMFIWHARKASLFPSQWQHCLYIFIGRSKSNKN